MFRLLFAMAIVCSGAAASDGWLQFSTPHFELFTDAGPGKGREVLRRFEQIRQVLLRTTGAQPKSAQPVRIFVFRSEREFATYKDPRRKSMAGFYLPGRDRDFIAMLNTGPEIYRVVFHEYVHVVMAHNGIRVPIWFNEGTAELFSTVETTNSQIKIGDLVPAHILTLRHEKMIGLPELMAVDHDSPLYNEENKVGIFYAESWAFVHMLNMHPRYGPGRKRFLELILTGTPSTQALQAVYGKSSEEVLRDLREYVNGTRFVGALLKTDEFEVIDTIQPAQLGPAEAGLALAELLIATGKTSEAARMLKKLADENPKVAGFEEGLGDTALAQHQEKQALANYQRAIELGSRNARIYFETAMLLRDMGTGQKQIVPDLQRAVEMNPSYWQARHLLGFLYLQDHQYAEAIEQLIAAAHLEPRNVNIWENLALAQLYAGNPDKALTAAKQGRVLASKPEEIERLDGTIQKIEAPQTRLDSGAPEQVTRNWQNRKGDQRIEGKLIRLDCSGKEALFHVVAGTREVVLHVQDPSKVVLITAPGKSIELVCGEFPARDVAVEYIAKPGPEKVAGEITALEFK